MDTAFPLRPHIEIHLLEFALVYIRIKQTGEPYVDIIYANSQHHRFRFCLLCWMIGKLLINKVRSWGNDSINFCQPTNVWINCCKNMEFICLHIKANSSLLQYENLN